MLAGEPVRGSYQRRGCVVTSSPASPWRRIWSRRSWLTRRSQGLPRSPGLWAALPALVIYAVLGSSRSLSMGPEATTALMTAVAIGPLAAGTQPYAALAATLALLVGAMSGGVAAAAGFRRGPAVTAGPGRLYGGRGADHDRRPARRVTGVPVTGQASSPRSSPSPPPRAIQPATVASRPRSWSSCCVLRWRWPQAPGPLLALLLATAAVAAFGLASHGVGVVGPIPAGLPVPGLPDVHPHDLRELLLPAFTVLIVGFSDDVLTARSFARRGEEIAANRELLALGAANAGVEPGARLPRQQQRDQDRDRRRGGQPDPAVLADRGGVRSLPSLLFARPVLARFPAPRSARSSSTRRSG